MCPFPQTRRNPSGHQVGNQPGQRTGNRLGNRARNPRSRVAALAVACLLAAPLALTGCGGEDETPVNDTVASFDIRLFNRTGHNLTQVYVHRIDPPLAYGNVAASAIEVKTAAPQTMPKKLEVEWVNPDTGKTEWAIAHVHATLGADYHGPVTITIYGDNDWKIKKGP